MRVLIKRRVIAAAVLAGLCGSAADAATTITVAAFPALDAAVKAAIPLYKKLHPDVEIKLVSLAYADHHVAMTTSLATGANLPDVMAVEVGFIGKFAESGGLEDLGKPPYNAAQFKDKFARFTVPQATGPNGSLAAIPADIGPGTLLYRKDLMDKAGVTEADLTKSWESYIESGKKLKAATGAYLVASAADIKDIYIRSGLKDGEGVYFDKAGKSVVDTPRFVKAFELAKAAHTAGVDGKISAWSNEWSEGFKRGQIGTQMMGAWLAGHLQTWLAPNTKGAWRAAQLPAGAFASWGGSFYAIPTKAAHKPEAWEFIKFLTLDKNMQIESFRKLDAFPALIEAQNDPFIDQPIDFLGGQKARQLWKVAAEKIPAIDVDKYDSIAQEIVNAELEKVIEQNKDIPKALADAKALIERRARRR
ncbi:ABC transporter substrate-binding protein [Niveibacterium microcysteis]|uniref:Extracellular solute-binding protein n=1 Tax=Niveibacterium microcysteis TaxID=2811415 RepID=A0ABX7M813_9RHOO|nr:extracellular solute-binding protein [Niveibacterium microcysteis]QSI76585.1 extracellular solute-binding protein [Niveibacterium microcysteis]